MNNKNKIIRVLALSLVLILSLSTIVGCGSSKKKDTKKNRSDDSRYEDVTSWPSKTSSVLGKKLIATLNNKYYILTDVKLGLAHGKRARANIKYKKLVTVQLKGNVKVESYSGSFTDYVDNYKVSYDKENKITNVSFKLNSDGKKLKKNTLLGTIKATDTDSNAQVLVDVYKAY